MNPPSADIRAVMQISYVSDALLALFRSVVNLRSNALAPKTWECYSAAFCSFLEWLSSCDPQPNCAVSLDLFVVRYCEIIFDDDPHRGARQNYLNVMSAIEFTCAEIAGFLHNSRQALRGWNRITPARSPAPFSSEHVAAMAGYFYIIRRPLLALAIQVTFSGYLRAGELLALRTDDVCFSSDPRLAVYDSAHAGLLIRSAKTGKLQFVSLQDQKVVAALRATVQELRMGSSNSRVFPISYSQVSSALKSAVDHIHLPPKEFTLHSLRHGGATCDFLRGVALKDVVMKGRWVSLSSCRPYLNAGQGLLLRAKLCHLSLRLINTYAEILRNLQTREGWTAGAAGEEKSQYSSPRCRPVAAAA